MQTIEELEANELYPLVTSRDVESKYLALCMMLNEINITPPEFVLDKYKTGIVITESILNPLKTYPDSFAYNIINLYTEAWMTKDGKIIRIL